MLPMTKRAQSLKLARHLGDLPPRPIISDQRPSLHDEAPIIQQPENVANKKENFS
jgi:hypothetical protein